MKVKILSIVVLFIFTHSTLFGWRMIEKTAAAETKPAKPVVSGEKMPNLSGAAAKEYLEKQGSYQSLTDSVDKAQKNQLSQQDFAQTKKLLPSDGGSQEVFGRAVAISGSTAVATSRWKGTISPIYRGAVYVFERDAGGANNWNEVKKLTAFDGEEFEEFGFSVAIDGDLIVVGKFQELENGNAPNPGSAYIFGRNTGGANNWGLIKKISATDGGSGSFNGFGQAVSVSGDLIIVGAQGATIGGNEAQGAAYIFQKNAGGANNWGEIKKITASDGQAYDQFGVAVDISGVAAIVGATGVDDGANINVGAAYIFERDADGSGNWGEVRKLTGSGVVARDLFGYSVSISNSTAVVGIQNSDFQNPHPGAAYVFQRDAGGAGNWGELKKLVPTNPEPNNSFGWAVSIDGSRLVVAEPLETIGQNQGQGAAYVYERNIGGTDNWGLLKKLTASDGSFNDLFGRTIAISGKTIIAGAMNDSTGSNTGHGSAYIFNAEIQTYVQDVKTIPAACTADDLFGKQVAIFGDTAVVGAPRADVGANDNQGAAYVFQKNQGGTNAWSLTKTLVASDGAAKLYFGNSVTISGERIGVGSDSPNATSAVYLFERNHGGANNWGETRKITAADAHGNQKFGSAISLSGDRLAVGASGTTVGGNFLQGAAYVFERDAGGANNWGQTKKIIASDGAALDYFGSAISLAGDTIVVGANGVDLTNQEQGSAYIFEHDAGGTGNWGETKKLFVAGGNFYQQFGFSVAARADLVVIGARSEKIGGNTQQGAAYLYGRDAGGAGNWGLVKKLTASDPGAYRYFGSSVAIEADTVVVGSQCGSSGAQTICAGSAYVFRQTQGGGDNWGETKRLTASDRAAGDNFGFSVALSGDNVLVGALLDDVSGVLNIGSAYLFTNSGTDWTQQAQSLPPLPVDCGADDQYGFSVAIDGDTAVVGAPKDKVGVLEGQGSAYVLSRNQGGANRWGVVKVLAPSDAKASMRFGDSVAMSGDKIIVAAPQNNLIKSDNEQGAVYIFERDAGGANFWGETKRLTACDGETDFFGNAIAISGDTAAVSEVGDDLGRGAVYLYGKNQGSAGNWGLIKIVRLADSQPSQQLGFSIALDGDSLVAGANLRSVNFIQSGAAFVFGRNAGGADNWGLTKTLVPSDASSLMGFGVAVAISGATAIVGAFRGNAPGGQDQGAAYIYARDAGGAENWGEVKKITASDAALDDRFGASVAIDGDTIIVGAPKDDIGANTDQGAAYIFLQNQGGANNWGQIKKIFPPDGAAGDEFGNSVTVSGDDVLVGSFLARIEQNFSGKNGLTGSLAPVQQGSAYVFRASTLAPTAAVVSVGGRVMNSSWQGVSGARVRITRADGSLRLLTTGAFGYFRFDEITAGETIIISVSHKRFQFAPLVLTAHEDVTDLNFTAQN